jgi:DNA-binding transcriptional LysR family regulator
MLEAVARGGLVAFVPRSLARPAVKASRVKVLAEFTPSNAGVHALFNRADTATMVRAAVDKLIENALQSLAD